MVRFIAIWLVFLFLVEPHNCVSLPVEPHNCASLQSDSVVAVVDGEDVTLGEFMLQARALRSGVINNFRITGENEFGNGFWSQKYDGTMPMDVLKKKALDTLVQIKVQQISARKAGIVDDISYPGFLKAMKAENKRRLAAKQAGKVIYGPVQYSEEVYYNYLFSNMVNSLKERMAGPVFMINDEKLKEIYEMEKDSLYRISNNTVEAPEEGDAVRSMAKEKSVSAYRSFGSCRTAIRIMLLDRMYGQYIRGLVKEAPISSIIFSNGEVAADKREMLETTDVITYYVDATGGNDGNNGLSPSTAWKTLTKVNSTTFIPGNHILFKANEAWTGRLYPKGSGSTGFPIIIDSYGTGNKPIIDGNGMTGTGVVYLYNQQYWEISNLEITNDAATGGDRRGVRIEAENFGTSNHIYLKNLNIHNIKGLVGQGRPEKRTGGIGFGIVDVSIKETHFNDILVENCVISSCDNQGIVTECVPGDGFDPYSAEWNEMKITNAIIRNNTISDISKNAMIIRLFEEGVIEHNLCYNTANGITGNTIFSAACSGTVFQYNEGYGNHSPDADGSMYDADLRSPNTYWQYSYSHDNAHGLFWTCTVQADANVVCRYNISQNDQGIIFCINYPVTSVRIYNNTVYCPANISPVIISERNNGGSGSRTYTFNNNLIYNLSPTASYDFTSGYNRTIDYNCFWGIHPSTEPADPHKITTDPKLVNAGSGGFGINTVDGYKLQSNSSCINKGKVIASNGGYDYWGNPLYNGVPDIGAHEYTLPPAAPSNLTVTDVQASGVSISWSDNSSNETGFRIERKNNAGSFAIIASTNANTTSYSDTGLSSAVAYAYRVCAFSAAGNSGYSNQVMATNIWTGPISSEWTNGANWLAGASPETTAYVTIAVSPNNPVISSQVTVKNVKINDGAMLTVAVSGILTVLNDVVIAGPAGDGMIFSPPFGDGQPKRVFDLKRNPNE